MSQYSPDVTIENVPLPIEGGNPTPVTVGGTISVTNFPATQPVSGTVSVGNFPATQPVSGPLTDTQLRATPVPVSGTVTTSPVVSNTATISQVVLTSNTNAMLLAANGSRKMFIVFAPKATLYLKFGATASSTSFTYPILAANTTLPLGKLTCSLQWGRQLQLPN